MELPALPETERTPLVVSLLAIIDAQQQRLVQLEETVQQLRDEIAVLKGQKPRPMIACRSRADRMSTGHARPITQYQKSSN